MRQLLKFVTAAVLGVASLYAQTTPGIVVSGKLVDGQGNILKTGYLHFQLYNCGANVPQIIGNPEVIVSQSFDLKPNSITGVISGSIFGNDQISCGGVASTQWEVTLFKSSSQPGAQPQFYCLTSPSSFDPSTTQPCTVVPPTPGFYNIFANPIGNQTWDQPVGTTGFFEGAFDFTQATVTGITASGGNATPAGPNGSVQIAEAGALAYDPNLTWDPNATTLYVGPPSTGGTSINNNSGFLNTSLPPSSDDSSPNLATTYNIHNAHINWGQLSNLPSSFPPSLPTTSSPGGVFMPASCSLGTHVYGIGANGQLLCSNDLAPSLCFYVNGTQIACGLNSLNFVGSSGMTLSGSYNSTTGNLTLTVTGSTATQAQVPVFNPLAGAYPAGQTVALSCASPAPTIYYTVDGTTPTHGSSTYSTPISVSNTTVEALCASAGLADSNVQTAVYTVSAPAVNLNPTSLSYPLQLVGSSTTQPVTLTNTGNATLSISSIVASGDFSETDNCQPTVNASGLCTINVTFTPTTTGTRSGTIVITDNASGSPHTISLTGQGGLPTATPSPSSLTFATQNLNTTSAAQPVTLSNSSALPLSVTGVSITGTQASEFTQSNNCTTVLPNGNCTINVSFGPTLSGAASATLNITDNGVGSPQTVALSGTGAQPAAPVVSISPSSLTFGTQKVATSSGIQTLTVTNTGNATLVVSKVQLTGTNTGDFSETTNCASVTAGNSCTVNVTFTPTAAGSRSASVQFTDNASPGTQTAALSGTGAVATANLTPSSLNFGSIKVGTSSSPQQLTLTNTSAVSMVISSITVGSPFSQTNNCGNSLNAGNSCTINVTFTPTAQGATNGTLSVTSDAGTKQSSLSGTGTQSGISLNPTSLSYGTVSSGIQYQRSLTVTNTGNANLNISAVNKTSDSRGAFSITSNNCVGSIAPNATCSVTVTWNPQLSNTTYNATFQILSDAPTSPTSFTATGTTNNL